MEKISEKEEYEDDLRNPIVVQALKFEAIEAEAEPDPAAVTPKAPQVLPVKFTAQCSFVKPPGYYRLETEV